MGIPSIFQSDFLTFRKGAELLITVSASLLGFIIAAVALIYALTSTQRFDLLRNSQSFSELAATSKAAMTWLFVASLIGAVFAFLSASTYQEASEILTFASVVSASQAAISTFVLTWVIARLVDLA